MIQIVTIIRKNVTKSVWIDTLHSIIKISYRMSSDIILFVKHFFVFVKIWAGRLQSMLSFFFNLGQNTLISSICFQREKTRKPSQNIKNRISSKKRLNHCISSYFKQQSCIVCYFGSAITKLQSVESLRDHSNHFTKMAFLDFWTPLFYSLFVTLFSYSLSHMSPPKK